MTKAQNMTSRGGNSVINQFILRNGNITLFKSYDSLICEIDENKNIITVDPYVYNYSRTTSKYLTKFFYNQGYAGTLDEIKKYAKKYKDTLEGRTFAFASKIIVFNKLNG